MTINICNFKKCTLRKVQSAKMEQNCCDYVPSDLRRDNQITITFGLSSL